MKIPLRSVWIKQSYENTSPVWFLRYSHIWMGLVSCSVFKLYLFKAESVISVNA